MLPEARIRQTEWIIFDFFWTLYRITPTPVALLQRFLKELNASLSSAPLEIVRQFAVADGYLYQTESKMLSASAIKDLQTITPEEIQRFFKTKEWMMIETKCRELLHEEHRDLQKDLLEALFMKWHQYWRQPNRQTRMIPETRSVLPKLADRGYRLVIASNSPWDLTGILKEDNLLDVVQLVITFRNTGYQKPSIKFFENMISKIPAPVQRIAFVGDSPRHDIEPISTLNVFPILIWRSAQHREPPPPLPSGIVINKLSDLLRIFPGRP